MESITEVSHLSSMFLTHITFLEIRMITGS